MKKIILCIVALAVSMTVFGQDRMFGVRAGVNISHLRGEIGSASDKTDSKASFNVGFAYQRPILRVFPLYLETGIYLASRGGSFDTEIEGFGSEKMKFNMLYLQIPAAVSLHFNLNKISIQPLVGVFYGFGIQSKLKFAGEKITLFKSDEIGDGTKTKKMLKNSDFGLRFGANVVFNEHYNISMGYDMGLINISKDAAKELTGADKLKNRSIYIQLGYNF